MREIEGSLDGAGLAVAVVVARFNAATTTGLLRAAVAELSARGVKADDILVVHVPGALELPLAAHRLAGSGTYDAIIVLGAVIRGDTDHYDFVCSETTRGCGRASLATGVPVIFGVLTCDTMAQAAERSGDDESNKGLESARAAVQMARVLAELPSPTGATP